MTSDALVLNEKDNVATALSDLKSGDTLELKVGDKTLVTKLSDSIPFGHKFSLTSIERGSPVVKYGEIMGIATADIKPGSYVHVHNVESARGRGDLARGTLS